MIPGLWGFSGRLVIEAQYWFGHLTQGGLRVHPCLGSIQEQTLLCGQRGLCLMGVSKTRNTEYGIRNKKTRKTE